MDHFRRIGFALAFSPTAGLMLAETARLKEIFVSDLVLIHVGASGEHEKQLLTSMIEKAGLSPQSVSVIWEEGDPADKILKVCQREKIDLLVAGALKRENLMQYYVGTIARKIMRKANCSLMMITNPSLETTPVRNVVVNAEDSPYVEQALAAACRLGRTGKDAWVHVVREIKLYGLAMAASGQQSESEYGEMRQHLVQDEIDAVEKMLAGIPHEGVRINIKMLSGKSGYEVSQFAQRKNADWLVVGAPSRRFKLFDRLFPHDLEYIFADMPCNLLIVNPGKEQVMAKLTHGELIQLMIQLSVMLALGRLMTEIARKLKQPAVAGEILAGIILGPTILGMMSPDSFGFLFPKEGNSTLALDGFTRVAVVLWLFIAGLEVDLHIVLQQGKQALSTSLLGLIIPFFIGFIIPYSFPEFFGDPKGSDLVIFSLFMGTAMGISALPVIVRILMDLKLFKTKIGMLIVASAMVDDIIGWIIFSVILSLMGKGYNISIGYTVLLTIGFAIFMLTIGRGLLNRVLPWVNRKLAWPGGLLSLSMVLCFLGAAFTEFIGIHAIFGAFITGVALGDSEHLSEKAKEIIHQFINNIFAPLFFVSIGLKINFITHFDPLITLVIITIAFIGKLLGSGLGAYFGGFTKRESLATGFGMSARGAMEIILGIIALDAGIINETIFVSLVIMALVTSMSSGALMRWALSSGDKN